tara:strand:- start:694 stop:1647 length:954 start_codon:yes stop_codon:yes gene_type:complete
MNSDQHNLLEKILVTTPSGSEGLDAQKFRAKHYQYLNELDELEQQHYIENTNGHYSVKLRTLPQLDKQGSKASKILFLCELIFKVLHRFYLERTGEALPLDDLAKEADIPRSDVNIAFPYLIQSSILGGRTTNFEAEAATVTPSEQILRYNSFREVVDQYANMGNSFSLPTSYPDTEIDENPFKGHDYINQARIKGLENLESSDFDFVRLIQICKEINANANNGNYFALGALIRMLLDHIPPIFGFNTFKEVSVNCQLGKSVSASLRNLENSSRKISDGLLHQKIRRRETLPTLNQVNFSPDIDVLLAEIIRLVDLH